MGSTHNFYLFTKIRNHRKTFGEVICFNHEGQLEDSGRAILVCTKIKKKWGIRPSDSKMHKKWRKGDGSWMNGTRKETGLGNCSHSSSTFLTSL